MTSKKFIFIIGLVAALIGAVSLVLILQVSEPDSEGVGAPSFSEVPTNIALESGTLKVLVGFDGTTTDASTTPIRIDGAKKVTIFQTARGDTSNSTSSLNVLVSGNATSTNDADFTYFNKLVENRLNANSEQLTRISTSTLGTLASTTYTRVLSMDLQHDSFMSMKCVIKEITDGGYYGCRVLVER